MSKILDLGKWLNVIKNKIMELTQQQMDDIDNILLTVDEDLSFEEKLERQMDGLPSEAWGIICDIFYLLIKYI